MRIRLAVVASVLSIGGIALAGCSSLDHGTVTGKTYQPSYTYYVDQCFSYGKYGNCTMSIPMPQTQPECWQLDLKDGSDTGSTCVDHATWDRYKTGGTYP